MNSSLKIYKNVAADFINYDFKMETLADDCMFTEGPVWNKHGYYLYSDTEANCIYRIYEDGGKDIFIHGSGTKNPGDPDLKKEQIGSNALAYDHDGRLLVCRHGTHDIGIYGEEQLHSFINIYRGKPFNSPNDFILHDSGKIYFSDPPYGLKDSQLNPLKFQPLAGVYAYEDGEVKLICDKYQYPNGVCLSPDQKILYICSNKPFERFISEYDTGTDQFIKTFAEENSDGIECDRNGNVYLCSREGLIVLDANGERVALIELPSIPSNICWGGERMNDLLITARKNVFLIRGLQITD